MNRDYNECSLSCVFILPACTALVTFNIVKIRELCQVFLDILLEVVDSKEPGKQTPTSSL